MIWGLIKQRFFICTAPDASLQKKPRNSTFFFFANNYTEMITTVNPKGVVLM